MVTVTYTRVDTGRTTLRERRTGSVVEACSKLEGRGWRQVAPAVYAAGFVVAEVRRRGR